MRITPTASRDVLRPNRKSAGAAESIMRGDDVLAWIAVVLCFTRAGDELVLDAWVISWPSFRL